MSKKSEEKKNTPAAGDWEKELERRVELLEQRADAGNEKGELQELERRVELLEQRADTGNETWELQELERRVELLEQRATSGAVPGKRKWRGTFLTAPNMRR